MPDRPHLCIVTTAHPLDDVRVQSKIASSFVAAGFKVSWVGPEVSYFAPEGWRAPGVDYYLTRPQRTRADRLLSARRVAAAARHVPGVDWYYSPDPDAAPVAIKLARSTGARSIFDIHELFHGPLLDRWLMNHDLIAVREYVRKRISKTCSASDLVIGVSDSVLDPYIPAGPQRLLVRNLPPEWFWSPTAGPSRDGSGTVRFMHGKALPARGTEIIIAALSRAVSREAGAALVMFNDVGVDATPYMPQLRSLVARAGVSDHVEVRPSVTHREMPDELARCHVGVIGYGRALGADSLPNRLFEYMAAGLAVLAPTYSREIHAIVEQEGIGLTVDFEDPDSVAEAMIWMCQNPTAVHEMGHRARKSVQARHNWSAEFEQLLRTMRTSRTQDPLHGE